MAGRSSWWVVASDADPDHGWHWDRFFRTPMDPSEPFNWGGPNWINSTVSFARIKEMRAHDHVVAYQAAEGILGFAELASNGYQAAPGGKFDSFDLAAPPSVRLKAAIPFEIVKDLPRANENFEFVRLVKQGSVFRVTTDGYAQLIRLAKQLNADQATRIASLE